VSHFVKVVVLSLAVLVPFQGAPQQRIVVVGDVHGSAGGLSTILQRAGLVDAQQKWIGGNAILVQTGDVTDRGTDVKAALDLLMAIEPQAAAAGGRVHALMGNHEAMNMLGETRDATAEIFRTFADAESERRRDKAHADHRKIDKAVAGDQGAWMTAHPLGFVEYREAFKPNGRYGKWLRSRPVLAEINGTVFMHAGLNPATAPGSLDDVNRRARQEIAAWDEAVRWLEQRRAVMSFATLTEVISAADKRLQQIAPRIKSGEQTDEDIETARVLVPVVQIDKSSLFEPNGPLWFRGFAQWSDADGAPQMAALLKKYRVKRFVSAHTPLTAAQYRIQRRFGGSLFLIDTGMLDGKYFPGGRPSALELVDDAATAIYEDGRVPFNTP
jgi:hypothetical protein